MGLAYRRPWGEYGLAARHGRDGFAVGRRDDDGLIEPRLDPICVKMGMRERTHNAPRFDFLRDEDECRDGFAS